MSVYDVRSGTPKNGERRWGVSALRITFFSVFVEDHDPQNSICLDDEQKALAQHADASVWALLLHPRAGTRRSGAEIDDQGYFLSCHTTGPFARRTTRSLSSHKEMLEQDIQWSRAGFGGGAVGGSVTEETVCEPSLSPPTMADVDVDPPAPPFASRDGVSTRSVKFLTCSSPPSIGGDSTRRKAFGMPSLLGRRAKKEPPADLDLLDVSKKLLAPEPDASENQDPGMHRTPPESPPANKQAPSKSRTLFRRITTKFNRTRARSTSPPAAVNRRRSLAIPQVDNGTTLASREARNAALRERGLLPALPLSVQEAQQDLRIAIVVPELIAPPTLERRVTAAHRIKEEWEAKNRMGDGSSVRDTNALATVKEVDSPLPSPNPQEPPPAEFAGAADEPEQPERKGPRAPPPALTLARERSLSPPLLRPWNDLPDADPCAFPLPPSPLTADSPFSSLISAFAVTPAADKAFTPISPTFLPLPPSPSPSRATFRSDGDGDGTPRPPGSPTAPRSPLRDTSIPRLNSSASESGESSLGVPSLLPDSASESQTTLSTADSCGGSGSGGGVGRMRNVKGFRNSTVEVEPDMHRAFEVIVESPVEERTDPFWEPSAQPDATAAVPDVSTPASPPNAGKGERRKSLMLSLRRSFGARRKSTGGALAGFNPALLPPSPTLPAEFAAQQQQRAPPACINPTMHSTGSIMAETSKIGDEETRRVTELAFM
ncbi:hypothetical protein GGX14DRAFT_403077 [Mycena pura]|uniref:Uncharacterized protein n=1 Tax=Mycena pura TaxID=153505 RepID=A0AAD6V156_9AGAR|nr:hypothetical protein GGX14DRAFT_403077 [Mycena pura]